jgi:excinuclease ABC subunit A
MEIARRILKEINDRLRFLSTSAWTTSTCRAASGTLSGGESQRIRLASQIGSGLTGVLYVLDEPSIGLHQRDNSRLLQSLRGLRDLGNSVLVVEHDEEAILTADYVIDMGPAPASTAATSSPRASPPRSGQPQQHHRHVPVGRARDRRAGAASTASRPSKCCGSPARPATTSRRVTAEIPVGTFTCITGCQRRRQVDLHHRDPLQGRRPSAEQRQRRPGPLREDRGAGELRQGHRHRPEPDRPHPAVEPGHLYRGLPADPRLVQPAAGEQGARLRPRPVQLQRQGRPLRGLPGRRPDQDRDALPAGRLRHLRRLQGQRYNRETLEILFKGKSSPTSST